MPADLAPLLQQVLNALQVGTFYALLAVSYVLLHGVSNRYNLAISAVTSWGGYVALGMALALFDRVFWPDLWVVAAAFGASLAVGATLGLGLGRYVIAPVMAGPPLTALVATLGAAIALEEAMRIATGNADLWLRPVFAAPVIELGSTDYPVRLSAIQLTVLAAGLVIPAALSLLMNRTRFGRDWRACSDDPAMLALLGVDVRRLIVAASVLSASLAATTGFLIASYYGTINFSNGFLFAMKALFVALVGGLRTVRGAVFGGLAVGAAETAWTAFFPINWRDVAVFAAFAALVALRVGPRGRNGEVP